ncbi:MAG: hypothetical protein IJ827_02355 [Lachnospiraceae bacterium]|nr:hypothetical protein [Lachnospiraceae bacterium]
MSSLKEERMMILKCPNCAHSLEIEDELDTFYCKYCGSKIMINDNDRLNAKIKIKEMEHEYEMEKLRMEREKEENKWTFPIIIIGVIAAFLAFILIFILNYASIS